METTTFFNFTVGIWKDGDNEATLPLHILYTTDRCLPSIDEAISAADILRGFVNQVVGQLLNVDQLLSTCPSAHLSILITASAPHENKTRFWFCHYLASPTSENWKD